MIKCSVIVPVYNAEKTICDCIESIQKSLLKEIEIIIINDESTDDTLRLCNELKKNDDRIVIINKKNSGAGESRNEGLKIAKGEYIAFVDADDWIEEDYLNDLYQGVKERNLDICFSGHTREYINGNSEKRSVKFKKSIYKGNEITNEILRYCIWFPCEEVNANAIFSVWTGIFKREIIEKNRIRFLNERDYYSEDSIFNLMFLSKSSSLGFIRENKYHHVFGGDSLTNTNSERYKHLDEWYECIYDYICENNLTGQVLMYLNRSYVELYINEVNKHAEIQRAEGECNSYRNFLKQYKYIKKIKMSECYFRNQLEKIKYYLIVTLGTIYFKLKKYKKIV